MSLRTLSDIKLPLGTSEKALVDIATKKLGKKPAYFCIKKKSLDARNKQDVRFVYTIAFSAVPYQEEETPLERLPKQKAPALPVVVVGSGPAGLFCALRLLARGITPIVVERGSCVEEREKKINAFFQTATLDENANVQFGEGGAGTFSDGKLNTQTHSPFHQDVLKTFVKFGAPEEILWLNKPHIGSDNLKKVVKNMRQYILEQGGQVWFDARLEDICIQNGVLKNVTVCHLKNGEKPPFSRISL